MKTNNFLSELWKPVLYTVFAAATLVGCTQDDDIQPAAQQEPLKATDTEEFGALGRYTYVGDPVEVGSGRVRSWVQLRPGGAPLAIGMAISASALRNLPDEMQEFDLDFPALPAVAPFKTMTLDWNPHGHEPGMYMTPHFDMHFYMITEEERMQITGGVQETTEEFATQYMPENYVFGQVAVPAMGVHWVDITSPEFNGQPFTKTFIFGSNHDKVIFYEPMVTRAYLKDLRPWQIVTSRIPQPAKVQKSGYYPTSYSIMYSPFLREYIVAMTGFRYRVAS